MNRLVRFLLAKVALGDYGESLPIVLRSTTVDERTTRSSCVVSNVRKTSSSVSDISFVKIS